MSIWLAQLILAAVFLLHGLMLLALPSPMRKQMASLPGGPPFFRFIGLAELLAAFGLTLPTLTGIMASISFNTARRSEVELLLPAEQTPVRELQQQGTRDTLSMPDGSGAPAG